MMVDVECDAEGCGRPVGEHGAKGYCPKHYRRMRRRGDVSFEYQGSLDVRHARHVDRRGKDECWPWLATRDKDGYGTIQIDKKTGPRRAHRVAYVLATGEQIPKGMVIRHTCDNPPCQNPAHLVLGTVYDNNRDRMDRGRWIGPPPGMLGDIVRRLSDAQVTAIRAAPAHYGVNAELARQYACSGEHIRRIRNGTRR